MADAAVDALGHERVALAQLERDRPVGAEVGVRAVEQPERDREQRRARDESRRVERVVREREQRRRDPDEGREEAEPRHHEQRDLERPLVARGDLDRPAALPVRRADRDHRGGRGEDHGLGPPQVHAESLRCERLRARAAVLRDPAEAAGISSLAGECGPWEASSLAGR